MEGEFCEVRLAGVGLTLSGADNVADHHKRATKRRASKEYQGRAAGIDELALLATAVHIVARVSIVCIRAFSAMEFVVPLPGGVKMIVAVPALEDVIARASVHTRPRPVSRPLQDIVAVPAIEDIIALVSGHKRIITIPAIEDIIAMAS